MRGGRGADRRAFGVSGFGFGTIAWCFGLGGKRMGWWRGHRRAVRLLEVFDQLRLLLLREREFFIDNLLVRVHFINVMVRWTGLAPWEFEFRCCSTLALGPWGGYMAAVWYEPRHVTLHTTKGGGVPNAFSAVLSTEGRVVGPCWEHLKPKGPKGPLHAERRGCAPSGAALPSSFLYYSHA